MFENQLEVSVAQCEKLIGIKLNTFNGVMNGTWSYKGGATTDGVYYSNSYKIFAFKTSIYELIWFNGHIKVRRKMAVKTSGLETIWV